MSGGAGAEIGAAAGGAKAGVAVSGIVIKYQKSVYDKKIAELNGYATKLDGHLATLEGYKNEVRDFWPDESGQKYVKVIEAQIQQIRTTRTNIDGLSNLYENLKKNLDDAQNTVSEKVESVLDIINALTGSTD